MQRTQSSSTRTRLFTAAGWWFKMRTKLAILALILVCLGCGDPNTPHSSTTIFGKCRFCAKPGYSSAHYVDPSAAQEAADKGDVTITGRIVCGECRKKMEIPK